jgi:hypothetical protein
MAEGISLAEQKATSRGPTPDLSSVFHHSATTVGVVRGTKRKRKDGVWELRVHIGRNSETGNPHQISRTFHGGARAADDALRDLVDRYSEGRQDGLGNTFGQLLDPMTSCI